MFIVSIWLYRSKSFNACEKGKGVMFKEDILHDDNKTKLTQAQGNGIGEVL